MFLGGFSGVRKLCINVWDSRVDMLCVTDKWLEMVSAGNGGSPCGVKDVGG